MADIVAPANAEGTKATILKWCKAVGDLVVKDEPLIELETDKVTVEIASPATGRLTEIVRQPDQEVTPGDVLGRINAAANDPVERVQALVTPSMGEVAKDALPARGAGRHSLSPSVRRLLAQHELAPDTISGSGRNGRITAQDVLRHAEQSLSHVPAPPRPADRAPVAPEVSTAIPDTGGVRVPHTPIRRRIAEHMARSLLDAPHVTTLFEVDLTRVMAHRKAHAAEFEAQGARLTLTAYFIAACARALRAIPEVNATFHLDAMELHADANIGIGTALGNRGLIVPVLRQVQNLNLLGVAQRLSDVVERARTGKLAPEEVRGGTFTISNHGIGGSLLAAPIIINQPQVAILGVGKLERRVCVVEVDGIESISIRSMCYLTLSIDHRALDAFQANAFLSHVVSTLESWADQA
jgi:2-oxoglutarate dehydrogenase E2 component (dihydrolipoamide succinyltransferase)